MLKTEQSWRAGFIWLQDFLQSYDNQENVLLVKDKPKTDSYLCFSKEAPKQSNGEWKAFSRNGAGTTGRLYRKKIMNFNV